jgi:cyanophycinase
MSFSMMQSSKGALFIEGGALSFENNTLWQSLVDLAGGRDARIAVMPTAAKNPLQAGERWINHLQSLGCAAFLVPISPRLEDVDLRTAVESPAIVDQIKGATGVFFLGGEQGRITGSLLNPDGSHTPVLEAIFGLWENGGVVGGSSAGAAIMSRDMFKYPPTVLGVLENGIGKGKLENGIEKGKSVDRGLGFLDPSWMVDQHFLTRGRLPRLLVAMDALGYKNGVGVEENTAIIVKDGLMDAVGSTGALIIDLSRARRDPAVTVFNLVGARLTYLNRSDRYDMNTGTVITRAQQVKLKAKPLSNITADGDRSQFHSNILSKNAVLDLLVYLSKSERTEMIGIASSKKQSAPTFGRDFAFRFYKGDESFSSYATGSKESLFTIGNINLDVFPV